MVVSVVRKVVDLFRIEDEIQIWENLSSAEVILVGMDAVHIPSISKVHRAIYYFVKDFDVLKLREMFEDCMENNLDN